MLVASYNPGYQKKTKDLKQSTKQRFIAIEFGYPDPEKEREIVAHEAGVPDNVAACLVDIGGKVRNLKGKGLDEGASTRLLIHAARLIREGINPEKACDVAILNPITDDVDAYRDLRGGLGDVIRNYFPDRFGFEHVESFDKYIFLFDFKWDYIKDNKMPGSLYLIPADQLPENVTGDDVIEYPDGQPAIKIFKT